MAAVILDSCGLLNLYSSGHFLSILKASNNSWHLPAAVERESRRFRQPDPDDPERLIVRPIDLAPAIDGGIISRCDCESAEEASLYVELAARIRDDGESMGLAIAKCRGWAVLTDDKKARRIAMELNVAVVATTEVLRQWSVLAKPNAAELSAALQAIERFANYRPGPATRDFEWWKSSLHFE